MGMITKMYRDNFLQRFDKDGAIPYYSAADFPGLSVEADSFQNSDGVPVRFFRYAYAGYDPDRLILFCPGIGPGHAAYLAEIETLCRAGFRVLTLDYTGCGESGGERLPSINAPTRDAMELLDLLRPTEEVLPIGHSLGGYAALSLMHLRPELKKGVVISGFVGVSDAMMGFVKVRLLADAVKRYERKLLPEYGALDNRAYLRSAKDRILWIHSTDDPMISYRYNAGLVQRIDNPNVRLITVEHKKHNPQYRLEALETMNAWIGAYERLVREKQLVTLEQKRAYFADKPIARMTEQDPAVYAEILRFLNE